MDLRIPAAALAVVTVASALRIGANPAPVAPVQVETTSANDAAAQQAPPDNSTLRFAAHSLEVAASARQLLKRPDYSYRDDCSGWISAVFSDAGIPMDGTVAEIYEIAQKRDVVHHHPIPRIGDLAFFDNTHDRNHNGQWDDVRTHIAVVIDVEPDGTALLAHRGSSHRTVRMNLLHPMTKEDEAGNPINGHLRRYGSNDTWSLYLASQLWTGFATVDPEKEWLGRSATHH